MEGNSPVVMYPVWGSLMWVVVLSRMQAEYFKSPVKDCLHAARLYWKSYLIVSVPG